MFEFSFKFDNEMGIAVPVELAVDVFVTFIGLVLVTDFVQVTEFVLVGG